MSTVTQYFVHEGNNMTGDSEPDLDNRYYLKDLPGFYFMVKKAPLFPDDEYDRVILYRNTEVMANVARDGKKLPVIFFEMKIRATAITDDGEPQPPERCDSKGWRGGISKMKPRPGPLPRKGC